jgi:hypothetical protein
LSKEQDPKNPVFHLWGKNSVSTAIKHPKERTKRFWVLGWALNKERKWINLNWPCNLSTLNCRKKIFKANLVVEFLFDRKEGLAKKDNSFFFSSVDWKTESLQDRVKWNIWKALFIKLLIWSKHFVRFCIVLP